jgi:SAM-dependent methyltransferase
MCGDPTDSHKVLGQRLSQTQGYRPKQKSGITVSVKKCTRCNLVYSSPLPIPFNIQDHYGVPPEDYWQPSYFEWKEGYFAGELEELKKLQRLQPGMKALDVGAGLGKCMISMEKYGFDVYGFEPSEPFYERAVSQLGIDPKKLKLGMIEDVEYEENFFDFITFGAVLEHLYHPAEAIKKALQWLKPGGLIHIEVPSSNYLIPRLINGYYRLIGTTYVTNLSPMHVPFHLYEFDTKSFYRLGERLGFTVEHQQIATGEVMSGPKVVHPLLKKYMDKTGTGMQLIVWLKKK